VLCSNAEGADRSAAHACAERITTVTASVAFAVATPAEALVSSDPVLTCTGQSTGLADGVRAVHRQQAGFALPQGACRLSARGIEQRTVPADDEPACGQHDRHGADHAQAEVQRCVALPLACLMSTSPRRALTG